MLAPQHKTANLPTSLEGSHTIHKRKKFGGRKKLLYIFFFLGRKSRLPVQKVRLCRKERSPDAGTFGPRKEKGETK